MHMSNLLDVDWSTIPTPVDDGAADHLAGHKVCPSALPATNGDVVDLSQCVSETVVYAYPMTGRPGQALPDGWDMMPGARGCTPQSCGFRDHMADLTRLGVGAVYGLSTQDTAYQREAVDRLHLPFPLLSDADLNFASKMRLPTFEVDGKTLLRRLTMIIANGVVTKVFYPVFPPDQNAEVVLRWLEQRGHRAG